MSLANIVDASDEEKKAQRRAARLDWWLKNYHWLTLLVAMLVIVLVIKL